MVTVLLATYNGERYLAEQIESLLSQTFNDFNIIIRDDGSADATNRIIDEYVSRFPEKVSKITGSPTGAASKNFFELLKAVNSGYVMFCDQDDVWLPEKIEKTYKKMVEVEAANEGKPVLIHSNLKVADGALNVISDSFFEFQAISPERCALNNLLVQNNVTGCTLMMNPPLLALAKRQPESCAMHDWWVALISALFGVSDYIMEPLMLYRQHGDNQVGAKKAKGAGFILRKFKTRKQTAKNYNDAFLQAEELLRLFGDEMSESQKETVGAYASLKTKSKLQKIKTIRKYDFRKNTLVRTIGQYFSI